MSLLGKLFGSKNPTPSMPALPPRGAIPHDLPLDLRIGSQIKFDTTVYRVAPPGSFVEQLPDGFQAVACYGHIDLQDGFAQHRFYTEGDEYLMVSTCGGVVESIKAFVFTETVNPPTKEAFRSFVMEHDHLGASEIDYAGKRWVRAVNSGSGDGRIPPMAFDETLYRQSPPQKDGDLTHYAMLYSRQVQDPSREEFLLVTGEDTGPNEFHVTYAVGLELTQADFEIV